MKHDESQQIRMVSIYHDRLARQSVAVSKVISKYKTTKEFGLIANVSCLNHLIHNSFISTLNICETLQQILPNINYIITILRKGEPTSFIGKKIPNHPKTRWIYLCDSLGFIVRNLEKINMYLINDWIESAKTRTNV